MNLFAYAKHEGVDMKELGQRGGRKSGRARKQKARLKKEFEEVQKRGDDWWNR